MSLVTDVLDALEAASLIGGATGWGRAATYQPPTPDKVVTVYQAPGNPPDAPPSGETAYDEPGFQVRLRGSAFGGEALLAKAQAVYEALQDATLAGTVYVFATQSGPTPLGNDANDRPEVVWNFITMRERGA